MKVISFLFLLAACASNEEHLSPEARLNRKLQQCYEESDSFSKLKSGRIKFALKVSGEGQVKENKIIESDFKDDRNLEACAYGILKGSHIDPPVKGQEFELVQPVKFVPVKK